MTTPLFETRNVLAQEPQLSRHEFLPIDNVTADFQLNANTELQWRRHRTLWDTVVGILRLEGLHKTYRAGSAAKPADGQITVVGKNRINDGETLTISDGVTQVVFEFDVAGDGVVVPNESIDISAATSIDDVRDAVITAINGSALTITAAPAHTLPPAHGGGGVGPKIDLFNTDTTIATIATRDAQNTAITDTVADEDFTHRGMSGARINYAIAEIYPVAAADINDGETFYIPARPPNFEETYEFDKDASVLGGNNAVDISGATTAEDVATAIVNSITANATDLSAVVSHVLASGYITALTPDKITEGETFTLSDGTTTKIFEFDRVGDGVSGSNVAIDISAATTMQAVRAAIIAAINGVGFGITAFNRGFGSLITLTNAATSSAANTGAISHTMAHEDFLTGPMEGYRARVLLVEANAGTTPNVTITDTVVSESFEVVGLAGGAGAGWDITSGRCILEGYDITFEDIPRQEAVVGAQNYLMVRIKERRLTKDSDPTEIAIAIPGIAGTVYGANKYRWSASVGIERFDAAPPSTVTDEENIAAAALCEFDETNGQSIVTNTEVPVRVTTFNRFQEPPDVSTKVSKTGDTMTGKLTITTGSTIPGIESTGGANAQGGIFTGQGTASGILSTADAANGYAAVEAVGGLYGVHSTTTKASSFGVNGDASGGANGTGVRGIGATGVDDSTGGPGVHAQGAMGLLIERTQSGYPHIRMVAHGNSTIPPTNVAKGDLWIPDTGAAGGQVHLYNGSSWVVIGAIGPVEAAANSNKDVLRYSGANSRWERTSSLLQEAMYFSPKDAVITVSNATLGNFTLEVTRGEISITATGTSAGASLELNWVVPLPPGFEEWGTEGVPVVVVPMKASHTTVTQEIEVYDAAQSVDHNPGNAAIGSTAWVERTVDDTDLTGTYPNTSNNQGNMIVTAVFNFGNTETITVGGLYIKSRGQNAFGELPYPA